MPPTQNDEPNGVRPRDGEKLSAEAREGVLQTAVNDMAAGRLDAAEVMRRFNRLGQLLTGLPELRVVRPDREDFEHALGELPEDDRMAALGIDAGPAHTRRARSAFFPKVFDARFLQELENALALSTGSVESVADLQAIASGLYCVAAAENETLAAEHNPLLEMLANLVRVETVELAQAFSDLGLMRPDGEETPEEAEAREARFRDALRTNPVIQAEFERVMRQQSNRLLAAISDGSIRPCLTREELAPILKGFESLTVEEETAMTNDEGPHQRQGRASALFHRYVEDPANGPAFTRFEAEFDAQIKEAIASGNPQAQFLLDMHDLWERLSEMGDLARLMLCHGSFTRLLRSGQLKPSAE